jgi:hypothetical protein
MLCEIKNPSAFHQLRIFQQERVRNTFEKVAATPAPASKRHTRAELEKIGSEMCDVPTRVSTKFGSETRNVPTPFYTTAGYETLSAFCTEAGEKQLRESQKAVPTSPPVQRIRDDWSAPQPFASIAPHAKMDLPLDEAKRYLIECAEEVGLQIANQSTVRTLRLRNRDSKSGDVSHVAFLAPAQVSLVIANGSKSAVIELLST